jgi:hypothetical protein
MDPVERNLYLVFVDHIIKNLTAMLWSGILERLVRTHFCIHRLVTSRSNVNN